MSVFDILITYHVAFLQGLRVTLELCLVIWTSGIVFGVMLGVVGANAPRSWGRFIRAMSFAFSAIPTLVVLFWLHYPAQAVFDVVIDPFYTASLTFALVNIFGVGEMVRQAVADFPSQFIIAGRVCGLSQRDIVTKIQLPILFRQLLPGMMTQQVMMLHATLFASLISVEEIFRVAQRINSTIYRPVEIYTALAMFFLAVCLPINLTAAYLKKRYTRDLSER
ncbi:MAG: ABC transporter permease subunit [Alphaproteobacteria bacterium]|nr:ABC transporter permease subunit [Alphaproteobacteria bacterium]